MSNRKLFLLFSLIIFLAATSSTIAQQAAPKAAAGRVVELKIHGTSLKGNLLADPLEQTIVVYLPPSYDSNQARRFPTVYLLHGFLANPAAWTDGGYQGMSLGPFMDEMIKSGKSREFIVVAPNGRNAYRGSFYTNSAVNGNWEDFILRDVVGFVDANYRTIASNRQKFEVESILSLWNECN